MVRKRLSDMLREEAQKPAQVASDEGLTGQSDTASPTQPQPATPRRSTTTGSGAAKTSQASTAAKEVASKEQATAIALEVNNLKAELAAAIKQTDELNQQVSELRTELENQIATAKKLQTASEKTERRSQHLETQLSEAKQTILQLVEVNSQLKQDLIAKLAVAKPTVAVRGTIPREIASRPESLPKALPTMPAEAKKNTLAATPLSQQELLQRQKKSLAHPVFPAGNPPGHLSEQDLGWVD